MPGVVLRDNSFISVDSRLFQINTLLIRDRSTIKSRTMMSVMSHKRSAAIDLVNGDTNTEIYAGLSNLARNRTIRYVLSAK